MSVTLWQEIRVRMLQFFSGISPYFPGRAEYWTLRNQKYFILKSLKNNKDMYILKNAVSAN